ncbi:MAG: serine/threonine-protein kinase [Planctomycetota bacterium]
MSFDELVGKEIGEYQIETLVGKGGLGAVFRARHLILDQVFALKMLLPEVSAKENLRQRFFREARKAAQVRHPNVVGVVNAGKHEDYIYLVMEYVDGITLQDRLKISGKLSPDETATIIEQTLEGLQAAHDAGIIHRDIKPDNVMITQKGEVKIADFGLARDVDKRMDGITVAGQVMGTPPYMSPEQWDGKELGAETDMYSLGVMMFQLLTGKLPFTGPSPLAIAKKVLTSPTPSVREFSPEVDDALAGIVKRMMAREMRERTPDAATALQEIRAWMSNELDGAKSSGTRVLPLPPPPPPPGMVVPSVGHINTSGFEPVGGVTPSDSDVDFASPIHSGAAYTPALGSTPPPPPPPPPLPPPPRRRAGSGSAGRIATPRPPSSPQVDVDLPRVQAMDLGADDTGDTDMTTSGVPTPGGGHSPAAVTRDDMQLLRMAEGLIGPGSVENLIGGKLGRYLLLAKIEGSTRTLVFFAEAPNGQTCVVKAMPFDHTDTPEYQQALLQFSEAAARVSHPNIAQTFEAGIDKHCYYIASANAEGTPLKQYLKQQKRQASVRQSLQWMEQLLNALSAAHQMGVYHLNIKPPNIVIGPDGTARLVELGLPHRWLAGDRHLPGSPLYMPMETWRGLPPTPATDLYALGVTWFQILVGRTPFLGIKPADLLKARLLNDCFQPIEMREDIPGSVNQMILRMMAREPEFRYQTADEALQNIFRIAGDMA